MPLPLLAMAGLSGASFLGGLLGNRKKTQTATSTQTQSLSPAGTGLNDAMLKIVQSRLSAPSALPTGYQESGIRDINRVYDVLNQNRAANLTSRGLADSPIAAVTDDKGRGSDIARFVSALPMAERNMRDQELDFASRLFALQPRTMTSSGTNTQPGNMMAGGFGDLASMLGFLIGSGQFGAGKKG